jgi:hypothetical protein
MRLGGRRSSVESFLPLAVCFWAGPSLMLKKGSGASVGLSQKTGKGGKRNGIS